MCIRDRIIAATNRDLRRAADEGQFREDLYYRLSVFPIQLPALRHRRSDILPLGESFLTTICQDLGRPVPSFSNDAREQLLEYHWPGNARELRNKIERAAILCDHGPITPEHLELAVIPKPTSATWSMDNADLTAGGPSSAMDLASLERAMIEQALVSARYNKTKAAKAIGLTRHQLYIRMRKHGIA